MADLLGIAQTGLRAAYVQLQTTGNNISNVNTPGYARQTVELKANQGQYTGSGTIGAGVAVVNVQRQYDQFLAREVRANTSISSGDSVRAESLGGLDTILSDTQNGIGVVMDEMRSAVSDLVNQPNDPATRTAVLARADTLANRFSTLDGRLNELQSTATARVGDSVKVLNDKLGQIAKLNQQIASVPGQDTRALSMVDQRDKLINEASEQMQLSTTLQSDGTVNVFAASGIALVVGNRASQVGVTADPNAPTQLQVTIDPTGNLPIAVRRDTLGAGAISAQLQFRDVDVTAARTQLGQLAASVAGAYNAQQGLGLDATGGKGRPMFAVGSPVAVASARNTGNAQLQAAVVDAKALQASDYTVRFDGSQYSIERMSDGTITPSGTMPATVDGLQFSVGSGAMAAGDTIEIQSASQFASGMRRTLQTGAGIATASPLAPQVGAANQGSATVASFTQKTADANAGASVTLTFTGPNTVDISGPGTGNPTGVTYTPGQALSYNGWEMKLDGTPVAGDTITLTPNSAPGRDNRNARAMAALGDQMLVGGTATFNNAYASMVADIGSRAASSQAAADGSAAMLGSTQAAFDARSGVNLDEEAARLLQYQQAYQASAKVIAAAQTMFSSILNAVNG